VVAGSNPVAPIERQNGPVNPPRWFTGPSVLVARLGTGGAACRPSNGAMTVMILQEKVHEETVKWVGSRPLTFAEFLDSYGPKDQVELIDGVVVERNMVQLDHEKLVDWLRFVIGLYVRAREMGIVLGSRTAVEINQFRGRLPDLLFVRQERMEIVQQKAIYGAPDLIIEVISPTDRPSDVIALETDYRSIGVAEIVFIDQRKHRVRVLRKQESDYVEELLTTGAVVLEALGGIRLEIEWLFSEPRPDERATADALLAEARSTDSEG
jgi:Uma2 family endonuclease